MQIFFVPKLKLIQASIRYNFFLQGI